MRATPRSGQLAMLAIAALAAAWSAAAPASAGTAPPAHQTALAALRLPDGPQAPHPGTSSSLDGVYCTSARSCLAVGFFQRNGAFLNEILRWNGAKWAQMSAVPSPGGTKTGATSELLAVRCTAPGNCWAVGFYQRGADRAEALHWNGRKWSLVATPSPGGMLGGELTELNDVTCVSAADCWAVGEFGDQVSSSLEFLNLALRWNGKKWSQVRTPQPGGTAVQDASALAGIKCSSATNCLAVGSYGLFGSTTKQRNQVLRWNGKKWSKMTGVPNPAGTAAGDQNQLMSLTCASPADCWAAGDAVTSGGTGTTVNQVLHFNGHGWTAATVPDPDGTGMGAVNALTAVTCSSAKSCVAVGAIGSFPGLGFIDNEALRWNGHKWMTATLPDPAGSGAGDANNLSGIRCVSASDCWAVGDFDASGSTQRDQILHWNGTKWSAS